MASINKEKDEIIRMAPEGMQSNTGMGMVILQGVTSLRAVGEGGSDGRAFERQHFRFVAQEFRTMSNNFSSNDVEVSYLPHSQAHKNPF